MELTTIITGLVFTALIALPIYWLMKSGSKERKNLLAAYKTLSDNLGLKVSDMEAWNDVVLGIDKNARKLLYFQNRNGGARHVLVDLDRVSLCKKVTQARVANVHSATGTVWDVLGLELVMKDNPAPVLLEFYNAANSFVLHDELLKAGKWTGIVNSLIKG